MAKAKARTLSIGSYSVGTLRDCDLRDAFTDAARCLRLTRAERATVREVARMSDDDEHLADGVSDVLDILNAHTPDYCYFGALEGDGADFGCWPVPDLFWDGRQGGYDGCVYMLPEGECPTGAIPATYSHAVFTNDHGNVTLYRRAGRRWLEVWSVV